MFTIAVIDDEILSRKSIARILNDSSLEIGSIIEASNAADALEKFRNFIPEIIIVDIRMPGMDGLALIQHIQESINPDVKAIIISGYSIFEYSREAIHLHVIDYILKPIKVSELIKAVEKAFRELSISKADPSNKKTNTNEIVKNNISSTVAYINKNYAREISLETVAALSFMNTTYFCEIFKKTTGKTFIEYLTGLRIEKAKELLTTTSLKIYEISEMVGYKNVNYFTRIFKKVAGIDAKKYRGVLNEPYEYKK